jgi:Cu(I)/Ag(I) efflux system membrane protein CusA/SilA
MNHEKGKNKKSLKRGYYKIPAGERMNIIERACKQVSRGVFFSTVIIITSFLPVFLLTGEEGKLFHPLAYTKTFIMAIDAILVITLAPVLLSFFMRGKFRTVHANPVNRFLEKVYEPVIRACIKWRKTTITVMVIALAVSVPMVMSLGTEFMPPLDEGTILFMPVTLPDVSNAEVKRILQVQDKILATEPEIKSVLGKAGRVNSATDNSPISMIETIVMLSHEANGVKA